MAETLRERITRRICECQQEINALRLERDNLLARWDLIQAEKEANRTIPAIPIPYRPSRHREVQK